MLRAAALVNDAALAQQRRTLDCAGRPDRRRAGGRRAQVRHRRIRSRTAAAHRRNPVHLRAQAPHHACTPIRDNPADAARHRRRARRKSCSRNAAMCGSTARPMPLSDAAPRRARCNATKALACQALRMLAIATRTVPAVSLGIDPKTVASRRRDRAARERRGRSRSSSALSA